MTDRPITRDQRAKLFALGTEQGHDIDALRAMTPKGSISMLTVQEAARLIDALERGIPPDYSSMARIPFDRRPKRREKGVYAFVSDAQRNTILALRIDLGWTEAQLQTWLEKRHFRDGRPMTDMQSSSDGVAVIELLKGVRARHESALQRKENHVG